jgi:hypothetical protein
MKVASRLFPYTAVDDCTRVCVLGFYHTRTAANSVSFLEERMLEELPFRFSGSPAFRGRSERGERAGTIVVIFGNTSRDG